jgi:TetR/AcrR family transcriptional repressor of nem operon
MKMTRKDKTNQNILSSALKGFKENGYDGIGVDMIANMANVTSGAFYAHFGSKENIFKAAVISGLDDVLSAVHNFQTNEGKNWLSAFAEFYLSEGHRTDRANSCALSTLTSEIARMNPELKNECEQRITEIVLAMCAGLKTGNHKKREERIWSFLAILIGGITITRAIKDNKLAAEISKSVISTALSIAGEAK